MDLGPRGTLQQLAASLRTHRRITFFERLEKLSSGFRAAERLTLGVLVGVMALSAFALLAEVSSAFMVNVPEEGGTLTEGLVGSPRFINPLLTLSDTDRDLSALVYSGLLRATPSGDLIPDLAEHYEISDDRLTYTASIRPDALFHDGTPVTADDVIFTIDRARDPAIKSVKRANWEGVTVSKIDEQTVTFTLKQPYSPFLENLTLGILPSHLWEGVDASQFPFSDLNVIPVGSGPYRVEKVSRSASGIPESYVFKAFSDFTLGKPHLSSIVFRFYQNEKDAIDAYERGDVESINGVSPENAVFLEKIGARIEHAGLPRVFAVFFNQNQNRVFTHLEVRKALSRTADRERIVGEVLAGYASPLQGAIPPGLVPGIRAAEEDVSLETRIAEAQALLEKNGWKRNDETGIYEKTGTNKQVERLSFSVATGNVPELRRTAELLKEGWERLGAEVNLKIFETGDLNQNIIRPRSYDTLLFGEIVGRELDLFAFWHASQRNDPGLNVASYASVSADKLLEAMRTTPEKEARLKLYQSFEEEIEADVPAVFLYAPDLIYILPKKLKGVSIGTVTTASERFLDVYHWYVETDRVWSVFTK